MALRERGNGFFRYANLLFIISQIFASYIADLTGYGISMSQSARLFPFALLPASYAFIIWFPLFLGLIAYGLYQFFSHNSSNVLLDIVGEKTAKAFFIVTLWLLLTQLFDIRESDFIFAITALCYCLGAVKILSLQYDMLNLPQYYLAYIPISAYTGWLSVASLLTISSALKYSFIENFALSDEIVSASILCAAFCFVLLVFYWLSQNIFYILPIIWGFIAIAVASELPDVQAAAFTCQFLLILITLGSLISKARSKNIFKK